MDNTEKFTGKANIYEQYRPSYGTEVYDFIIDKFNLPKDCIIADIGAGTGKFSKGFIERGVETYCVEPNVGMKAIMDNRYEAYPNYHGFNGNAESTGLGDGQIDCITVAQAFHWFDRQAFKKEAQRILKENGKVVLVWNTRDEDAPINKELYGIDKEFCPSFQGFTGGIKGVNTTQFEDFYKQGSCEVKVFDNNVVFDSQEAFIGRCLSSSYALVERDNRYAEYVQALKALYGRFQQNDKLAVKHNTVVYWGEI